MGTLEARFGELAAAHRAELLVHCYRMLGSMHEAEDLVQETYLRAWRSRDAFEGRSSARTYLYRIATNACLSALRRRSRRGMPADGQPPGEWLEPIPDAALPGLSHVRTAAGPAGAVPDPAAVVDARAGVRLAFIAALQHLPPARRAVLILRDVLDLPAAEVALVLDTTVAAVNSALPRARAQIARVAPVPGEISEPPEPRRRAMLDRYVAAFQEDDLAALIRLLRADIVLEMPPLPEWYRGRTAVGGFFAARVFGESGQFRMVATAANGQPACLALKREPGGGYRPHAVHVLTLDRAGIAHLAVFLDPAVCALFGA